jgi:hypothetical protein
VYKNVELLEGQILQSRDILDPYSQMMVRCNLDQKWDGQKTPKYLILGTSLQGVFQGSHAPKI